MKKIIFVLWVCCYLITSWTSCDLFNNQDTEPLYKSKIAWDSGLISNFFQSHTVYEDSVYFFERPPGYDTVNIYSLTKINAETGNFVWRSFMFSDIVFCQPVVIGNYVYVFLVPNIVICFDKSTGKNTAIVQVDIDNKNLEIGWNVTAHQQYLYLELWTNGQYFVRVDVNEINQSENIEIVQVIMPEILWEADTIEVMPEEKRYFTAKPVIHNNTVFTSTYNAHARVPVELAGFNIETKQMVFYQTFGGPEDIADNIPFPEKGAGVKGNPILINDDILYYLSTSITAWNISTEQQLYRHIYTSELPQSKRFVADSLQPVFYKGKIYYTGGVSASQGDYRNIHCIDATTGELVWNAIAEGSETLDTNPIIAHDRLYVSQHSGLRVYNPENGRLIGVDRSFCGAGMGRNVLYKDYMICVRIDPNTGDGRLVAVNVGK